MKIIITLLSFLFLMSTASYATKADPAAKGSKSVENKSSSKKKDTSKSFKEILTIILMRFE
ncbi:MAG: hypothetical protein H0U39_04845 [Segetibacter sp.]|nr:hypothetical protein [Segetibacter sp.]